MISKGFTDISRSEPDFPEIDGHCSWSLVLKKVTRKFPKIDPNTSAEERLETWDRTESVLKIVGASMTTTQLLETESKS